MIYTLIGSRETPPEILTLMTKFAYKAALQGYKVRSGGAGGADRVGPFWRAAAGAGSRCGGDVS